MATRLNSLEILVTTGSGNGLWPEFTKPLPAPMLTHRQWGPVTITWELKKKYLDQQSVRLTWKSFIWHCIQISLGPMRKLTRSQIYTCLFAVISDSWPVRVPHCHFFILQFHPCRTVGGNHEQYGPYQDLHNIPCPMDSQPSQDPFCMMTSSNGNIFRVTGPLCGEFTGPCEFPKQRPVTRSFDVFFDLRLNKRLSKQPWGWWFETLSWPLWRHCNNHAPAFYRARWLVKVIRHV